MRFFDSQGSELCDVEFVPQGKETYISKATYLDDGTEVPDDELDAAQEGLCLCYSCRESS